MAKENKGEASRRMYETGRQTWRKWREMIVDVDIEAAVAAQKLRNEEQARGRGSIRISALSRSTDNGGSHPRSKLPQRWLH